MLDKGLMARKFLGARCMRARSAVDPLLGGNRHLHLRLHHQRIRRKFQPDLSPASQLDIELGEQFGISRIVVREALADLVRNNLIYKIKGRGAFVAARERDEDFVSTVLGFSDEMERKGRSVRTQILSQQLRDPTPQEISALGLTDDTQVVALKRLRSVDGELRLLVETVVPADLAPGLHRMRLDDRSLYDVLRRQYGVRLVRAERWIDAVLPDAETCGLLQLEAPEPLLRIESIAYGANGRRLEYYNALHRCKSSRLHVQTTT